MSRVLSALVLLPPVIAVVGLLPPLATLLLVEIVVALACWEYVALFGSHAAPRSPALVTSAAMATCAAAAQPSAPVDVVLMAVLLVCGAAVVGAGRHNADALGDVAAAVFAPVYLGLPLGALAALRAAEGAGAVLLFLATVMISDTAQYYGGRLLGRRPLAPAISPHKTVEGAVAGLVSGTLIIVVGSRWVLPGMSVFLVGLIGLAVTALGIVGDLFESVLKRSAGVKDASALIPGHGGMLDRIDSLLFAAPVYCAVVRYGF